MIREISFYPEFTKPLGLKPSDSIQGLDRIVILVGPNGAGKSRYLRLVQELLETTPRAAQEHTALTENLRRLEARLGGAGSQPLSPEQLLQISREVEETTQRLAFLSRLLESGGVLVDGPTGSVPPTAQDVCINLTLRPFSLGEERSEGGPRRDTLRDVYQSVPDFIERAARALFNAEHAQLAARPSVMEAARDARQLNDVLAALLDKRIEPDVDMTTGEVHARLGERRFDAMDLSSGERVLLTWAVLLHRHASQLRDAVLIIDEPENYLHPAMVGRLLSRLWSDQVLGQRGQVWMATHSPMVLLAARAPQVLLVEDGALRWAEPSSPLVLDDLTQGNPTQVQLPPRPLPIGGSDFQKLRRGGLRYVDKTELIAEVLRNPAEVLLFSRPRRFGKTMNQSMLRYFLEKTDEDRSDIFRDLAIWSDKGARLHFQRYPVINLTFKEVKARTWSECRASLSVAIANAFAEHGYVLEASARSMWEERFNAIMKGTAESAQLRDSLRLLSEILASHHGQRVVMLIDEYDAPIYSAYNGGYYDEAVDFVRSLLSGGLKDNQHLFKGVLTGVLRVAKESLFSGLNNVVSYSLLRPEFASRFGFTEAEVAQLLRESGEESRQTELQAWYDGYRFGDETIYNPWSVANYLSQQDREPRPYWTDTSDNDLLKRLLIYQGAGLHGDLQVLLRRDPIHKTIAEDVVLRDIDQRPDAVWSLLLFSGYLTVSSTSSPDAEQRLALTIPNKEVFHAFERLVQENLVERFGSDKDVVKLTQAVMGGDERTFEELLQRFMLSCMSSHSAAGKRPEMFYEGFLLALLVILKPDYDVQSQPNAGLGRADIVITPRESRRPGVVLELKTLGEREPEHMALDAALKQIEDRRYAAKLEEHGAHPIHKYGAIFDGQRVWVKKQTS